MLNGDGHFVGSRKFHIATLTVDVYFMKDSVGLLNGYWREYWHKVTLKVYELASAF